MFPSRKSPWTTVGGSGSGTLSASHAETSLDARDLARLVDLPELREAPHLALVVAPRSRERGEAGRRDVGRVDLDERVDEVVAERPLGGLALEPGRQLVRRDEAVEVRHHVERDAEQALVLADRDDRRQPR